jgi:hypothetical protein
MIFVDFETGRRAKKWSREWWLAVVDYALNRLGASLASAL